MEITDLVFGAIIVVGIVQWFKGVFKKLPVLVFGISVPLLAFAYSFSPEPVRFAAGIIAISQLGYETLFQPVKTVIAKLASK